MPRRFLASASLANAQRLTNQQFSVDSRPGEPAAAIVGNRRVVAQNEVFRGAKVALFAVADADLVARAVRSGDGLPIDPDTIVAERDGFARQADDAFDK